jgi:hypothetical protein
MSAKISPLPKKCVSFGLAVPTSTVKFEIVGLGNANMYYNGEND